MKPRAFIGAGVLLGVLALGAVWLLPSDSYLLLPDRAKPLEALVKVEGEKRGGSGGIYYVDVIVRKATLLEKLVPALRPEGADLVPEEALVPPGSSFAERRRQNLRQMDRSEEVAAAVALRELGYEVDATPEGAQVVAVASDAPAAGKLEPTEVIVAVDGKPVQTPDDLRRLIALHEPGDTVRLRVRAGGATRVVEVGTVESEAEPGRPIVGIQVEQFANIKLPIGVEIDLGNVGGPLGRARFRARRRRGGARQHRSRPTRRRDGRARARRRRRADRRHQAEGDRRQTLRGGRLHRPGWGQRRRGTPSCRGSPHHPCGEF